MWSFGCTILHLPEDFEERFTFAEYFLFRDRWIEAEAHHEFRASMITAAIYNVNRGKSEPIDHDFFMRQPFKKEPEELEPEVLHAKLMFAFGPPDKEENHEAGGAS